MHIDFENFDCAYEIIEYFAWNNFDSTSWFNNFESKRSAFEVRDNFNDYVILKPVLPNFSNWLIKKPRE